MWDRAASGIWHKTHNVCIGMLSMGMQLVFLVSLLHISTKLLHVKFLQLPDKLILHSQWSDIWRTLRIQVGCAHARTSKKHYNAFQSKDTFQSVPDVVKIWSRGGGVQETRKLDPLQKSDNWHTRIYVKCYQLVQVHCFSNVLHSLNQVICINAFRNPRHIHAVHP